MRVDLTDEQEFLREAVAGVVARDAGFAAVRVWTENQEFAEPDTLAERQGWTGIGLDEERGGQGGGAIELMVLAEQLGRGAVPWDRTLAGCLAAGLLAAAEGEDARELAAAIAEGERHVALAVDGRRPLAAFGERPAEVRYVLGGAAADELLLPVAGHDGGVELLAVAADAPGVSVRRRTLVDRTRSLADVELDDADTRALGAVPREALDGIASTAAVLVAADALGSAGRLLDLTTQYVG